MKAKNLLLPGVFIASMLMFIACDKSEKVEMPSSVVNIDVSEQQEALDEIVESIFNELDSVLATDFELKSASMLKSASEEKTCLVVTVDKPEDARYPKVITFDYGTEDCADRFGRVKKGKVIVTKTGPHWVEGSERTVTFEEFYVNDNKVEGTRKYKNEGKDTDGNWQFSTNIDVTIQTVEETTCTRKAEKMRTMIAGAETPRIIWDDEFLITGSSSGECSLGYSVVRTITTPIYRKRVCRFPVSGVIETVKTKDGATKTTYLDYGEGECDYKAIITDEDGATKELILGKRFKKK